MTFLLLLLVNLIYGFTITIVDLIHIIGGAQSCASTRCERTEPALLGRAPLRELVASDSWPSGFDRV